VTVAARRVWVWVSVAAVIGGASVLLVGVNASRALRLDPRPSDPLVEQGRRLFQLHCSTCHGLGGRGTHQGPSLRGVGAAAADFQLSTGRMPLDAPDQTSSRKRPAFDRAAIAALTAYVASLGDGPPIPRVDVATADVSRGQRLYSDNCAGCHAASGAGGALGVGASAPSLHRATPVQVVEALRTGPGPMPVFGSDAMGEQQAGDIARYVQYLRQPEDPGGLPLGRIGPIPEGFVAWIVGLGALLLASRWIGARE